MLAPRGTRNQKGLRQIAIAFSYRHSVAEYSPGRVRVVPRHAQPSNAKRRRIGAKRNGDNAGQDASCVRDGRTGHPADRRASSSRSMQKSEKHL